MFEEDWIMRQIENMVIFLTTTVLKKDMATYRLEFEQGTQDTDRLYRRLDEMIGKGKINEAENLLFDRMDKANSRYLPLAVSFYSKLNSLDDAALEKAGYQRDEIEKGLRDAANFYGVTVL